jgi:hypothetical protein
MGLAIAAQRCSIYERNVIILTAASFHTKSYKDLFAKRAASCRVSADALAKELGLGEFLH